mmetsp:Transcript_20496/g.47021  ORF Transcript_20496/g.47021 Transcript_20496/m.47021 type:complete len:209 (+) Transcript_20496:1359-1985(+)
MIAATSSRFSSISRLHLDRTDDRACAVVPSLQPGSAALARPMASPASPLPILLTSATAASGPDDGAPGSSTRKDGTPPPARGGNPPPSRRVGSRIEARSDGDGAAAERPEAPLAERHATSAADRPLMAAWESIPCECFFRFRLSTTCVRACGFAYLTRYQSDLVKAILSKKKRNSGRVPRATVHILIAPVQGQRRGPSCSLPKSLRLP